MPAIPKHNTAVDAGTWDANENVSRIPDGSPASVMKRMYAWVDPSGDSTTKSAYKFPHHFVSTNGVPGAASINACRNAMARIPQADIPTADVSGVQAHIQNHMDAAKAADKALKDLGIVTRSGAMCIRAINSTDRTADFVASTDAVDAHGDVIDQMSWRLDDYKSNPVVLYGHDCGELPIGQCTSVGVRGGQLECTIKFASAEANPRAEEVWRLVQEKVLRAVSVGFMPTDGMYEMRGGEEVFVWRSPVLKEISVVPVPANPEALARAKSALRATHDDDSDTSPAVPGELSTETRAVEPIAEESEMTEQEIKALQTKLAAYEAGEVDLKVALKAATDAKAASDKSLADAQAAIKSLETEKAALDAQTKALADERDAQKARAEKAEAVIVEQEVEALVGKKITPAEKPLFVDLRKANPDLFAKMIEQRQPLVLDTVVLAKSESNGATRSVSGDTDALLAEFKKSAGL